MTMITKRLAAVSAGAVPSMGVFGPKRAGDRLAGSAEALNRKADILTGTTARSF
jgi:hypothetical protein